MLAIAACPFVCNVTQSYVPPMTSFLNLGKELGLPLVRGVDLLICQGLASFRLWMGGRFSLPCFEAMASRVREQFQKMHPSVAMPVGLSPLISFSSISEATSASSVNQIN
jgi:hypothetical protein